MKQRILRATGIILTGALLMVEPVSNIYGAPVAGVAAATSQEADVNAKGNPTAGVSLVVSDYLAQSNEAASQAAAASSNQVSENQTPVVAAEQSTEITADMAATEQPVDATATDVAATDAAQTVTAEVTAEAAPVSEYANIAIAQVDNYVNVRAEANTESEVLGKLYNNSAATILETTADGWYKITSGSVTGYVKCEYVVAGDEELARAVSTRYAQVTTETLKVRTEPSMDASVLGLVPMGDDLVVLDESTPGWVRVTTEEGEGYVSTDYVTLSTDFVQAESKEEEAARLAKEEADRQAAAAAAAAARQSESSSSAASESTSESSQTTYSAPTSSNGQAVANYACQFVGNPYVYGGSSLTNGTDCSGFVMSVYGAFGISLPHSSSALRGCGYEVSLSQAQPGDIVCYSGHVGIYIGNGTIVHASTPSSGITYSNVNYRSPICVRRIF